MIKTIKIMDSVYSFFYCKVKHQIYLEGEDTNNTQKNKMMMARKKSVKVKELKMIREERKLLKMSQANKNLIKILS